MFEMGRASRFNPTVWRCLKRFRREEGAIDALVADVWEGGLFEVCGEEGPEGAFAFLIEGEGALFAEGHFLEFLFPDLDDIDP